MPRARLTDEVQAFIVRSVAFFDSPKTIIEAIKEKFGIDIVRQTVEHYDPTCAASKAQGLAKKWRTLFDSARAECLAALNDVDLSHKVIRMRKLTKLVRKLEEDAKPNVPLADAVARLLEQAAKEAGEAFTNKRELTGRDGQPLAPTVINFNSLSLAELERLEGIAIAAEAKGRKTIEIPFTPVKQE